METSQGERFQRMMLAAAICLACAFCVGIDLVDPDLWGHVQYGRDALNAGQILPTATYTFTAEGFRWINHENLSEISLALVEGRFGPRGLLWLKLILSLFIFGAIMAAASREGVALAAAAIMAFIAAQNLGHYWSIRPQMFSFFYYTLLLLLLHSAFRGWRGNWHLPWPIRSNPKPEPGNSLRPIGYSSQRLRLLWLAPGLFFLWANTHGAFVAGIAIYSAYLGLRAIEAFLQLGSRSWGLIRRLVMMIAAAWLATLINPYGPRLHHWLLESLIYPRPEVSEWAPTSLADPFGIRYLLAAFIAAAALLLSRRQRDFTETVVLVITLVQAYSVHRHVPFFVLAAAFWLPVHLASAAGRFSWASRMFTSGSHSNRQESVWGFALTGAVVVALVFGLWSKLQVIRVEKGDYPVDAFQYMADQGIAGRMVVSFNWAQYALAAFAVEENGASEPSRLSFDGRYDTCYPPHVVDWHFDFLSCDSGTERRCRHPRSRAFDPTRILDYGHPEIAVLRRHHENSTRVMATQTESWCLLYQDAIAQVWGRKSRFDSLDSPDYIPPEARLIGDRQPYGVAAWPALPQWKSGSFVTEKPASNRSVSWSQASRGR